MVHPLSIWRDANLIVKAEGLFQSTGFGCLVKREVEGGRDSRKDCRERQKLRSGRIILWGLADTVPQAEGLCSCSNSYSQAWARLLLGGWWAFQNIMSCREDCWGLFSFASAAAVAFARRVPPHSSSLSGEDGVPLW